MIHENAYNSSRTGFTLIELLIVMSIITVLMGLSAVVLYGVTDSADEQATISTIAKLNGLIEQRAEAFERAFGRDGSFRQRYIDSTNALLIQKNIYGVRPEVVGVLAKKVAFRHLFPQRHEDLLKLGFDASGKIPLTAFDGDDLLAATLRPNDTDDNQIDDAVDATVIAGAANVHTADAAVDDSTVSSELLYFTLVHSGNFGATTSIADQFSASEIADTDEDGLLEFVDAFGEPLRFYRWPTRLIDPNTPNSFQPNIANLTDNTDIRQPGDPDTLRWITTNERTAARMLIKGLPPAPVELPNGVLPRDHMFIDPDDPIGRLYSEMERLDGTNNKPQLSLEYNEKWYHSPETFSTPLVVSAGADLTLGLYEPSDIENLGNLANYDLSDGFDSMISRIGDNITSRNRRSGARR
jgi:prepilin-type N-terminal cleavage/methylation domain-containing protein